LSSVSRSAENKSARLDAQDWINAAFDVLAFRGIDRVAVEPLAKILGVTKGSFYWHFKDRDALLEALLKDWRNRSTEQIIARIEYSEETPALRLRQLLRVPFGGHRSQRGAEIELSIRLWGRSDERAKVALQEVDSQRLRYIERLLTECGLSTKQAEIRSILAYSYMRVSSSLIPSDRMDLLRKCEDAIVGAEE
jgi:AcrR family transcriptional regulator